MKKQNSIGKLLFKKTDVTELNQESLQTIVGGTGSINTTSNNPVVNTISSMPLSCTLRIYSSNGNTNQNN